MKTHLLIGLAVGLLVAANAKDEKAAKKELKKLEGSWVMVSGERMGEKLPEQTVKDAKLTISGNRHTVKVGEDMIVGTHELHPAGKPKGIDATDTEGPFKGKTVLGIYKLEKDKFTVCFAEPGKERPKEFSASSGTGQFIHVWKKQK